MWFFRKKKSKSVFLSSKEVQKLGREIGILYSKITALNKLDKSKAREKKIIALSGQIGDKEALLYNHYQHSTHDAAPLVVPNPESEIEHQANGIFQRMADVERRLFVARTIKDNLPRELENDYVKLDMVHVHTLVKEKGRVKQEYADIGEDLNLLLRVRKENGTL